MAGAVMDENILRINTLRLGEHRLLLGIAERDGDLHRCLRARDTEDLLIGSTLRLC